MAEPGRWFDGRSAREQQVWAERDGQRLTLSDQSGERDQVALADLVRLSRHGDEIRLGHRSVEGWRLMLPVGTAATLLDGMPRRGQLDTMTSRAMQRALIGLTALVSAALAVLLLAPDVVARHLPLSVERRIGAGYDLPISIARCDDPAARRALEAIIDRLDPAARRDGFTVELVKLDEVNAAALPGGRMVVLSGLFKDVNEPDALAGILAHEIAHVRRRHVARAMVRQLGMSAIVTLLGGGSVAGTANGLLDMRFTRLAEAEADADAVATLRRVGIDPRPTARALAGLGKLDGTIPQWLRDHPASAGRAKAFAVSYDPAAAYRPVSGAQEQAALAHPCQ